MPFVATREYPKRRCWERSVGVLVYVGATGRSTGTFCAEENTSQDETRRQEGYAKTHS